MTNDFEFDRLRRLFSPRLLARRARELLRSARRVSSAPSRARSLRTRITVALGALLTLGLLNIAAVQYGAHRRSGVFEQLQRAIERQTIILETMHRLERQQRQIKLVYDVMGVEAAPPSDAEREQFEQRVDSIPAHLVRMLEISRPGTREELRALREKTGRLVDSWKRFHDNRGVDPVLAITELVQTAEPLAAELLNEDYPEAVDREKNRLVDARQAFVEADRTASRFVWTIFFLSLVIGGFLAVRASRDLLRAITALRVGADKVGQGDLQHRIELQNRDELGDVAESFNQMADRLRERTVQMEEQRQVSESLLLNILPRQIARELQSNGRVEARYLSDATIMFADLVRFTRLFETLSVDRMVRLLDQLFTDFDRIVRSYQLEKLKTIGDAYMCAGGISDERASHPIDMVLAAFDIVDVVERRARKEGLPLSIRVGIHTGPVASGVVGIDKFAFDVWGETVNFAARLEDASEPDRINISRNTYLRVKDFFTCEYRGPIETKGYQPLDMYFVTGLHPEVADSGESTDGFETRYRKYFQRVPARYPEGLVSG